MTARTPPQQSSPIDWTTKAAIISVGILSAYEFGGLIPVLPHIQEAFAKTPGSAVLVRFMVSCLGVSMIVGSPLAGILAKRFGFRPMLSLSLLVYAFAGMAGAVLNSLIAIVISRIIFGLGAACCGTLLLSLMATLPEQQRNRWLGGMTTIGTVSTIILIPLAGYLGGMNWRWPFLLHAIALPVAALAIFGIRRTPEKVSPAQASTSPAAAAARRVRFPFFLFGIAAMSGVLTSALQLFVPFHLHDIGQSDPKTIGLLVSTSVITTGILAAAYGWLRRFVSLRAGFIIAPAIMAFGYLITAVAGNIGIFVVSMLVVGVGVGILMPHFYALAAITGPSSDAPHNLGLARAGYYTGPLIAQILLEPVIAVSNADIALLTIVGFGLAVGALMIRLPIPVFETQT